MKLLAGLVSLFVLLPLAELALLIWIGTKMGLGATLLLVFLTGAVGAGLAKWQGLQTLHNLRKELMGGRMPPEVIFDGVCILVAGAFLVTPGIITDLFGFSLLIPPVRAILRGALKKWARRKVNFIPPVGGIAEAEVENIRTVDHEEKSE